MDPKEKTLDHAADVRKFEISLFWQRSLFFWGFIAAAFIAYVEIAKEQRPDSDLLLGVSAFGVVGSVTWTLANRGSKYWQENWERKLKEAEKDVLGTRLFSQNHEIKKQPWWGAARYSVSRLTIALSDFMVMLWGILYFKALPGLATTLSLLKTVLFSAFLCCYLAAIFIRCKSRNR